MAGQDQTFDLLQKGLELHRQGALAEAAAHYAAVLQVDPHNTDAHYYMGMMCCQQGHFADGAAHARRAIQATPADARAHVLLGRALGAVGHREEALTSFERAIVLAPELSQAYAHRADTLVDLGRHAEAIRDYDRALSFEPERAEDWFNRGVALEILGQYKEAIASFEHTIAIKPDFLDAHLHRAKALSDMNCDQEALESLDRIVAGIPNLPQAWVGRGNILNKLKRSAEAFHAFDQALMLEPNFAAAWLGRGIALAAIGRSEDALAAYERALTADPDFAEAWLDRGNALFQLRRYAEALSAYQQALTIAPNLAAAWAGRGSVLDKLKQHLQAAVAYREALKLDPSRPFMKGLLLHQRMLACDWNCIDDQIAEVENDINSKKLSAYPFGWQGVATSPRSLQICAELYNGHLFPPAVLPRLQSPHNATDKIRIGYSSGEFREQATSHLIVGLLEEHDRSRFQVYAIDNGWDDKSRIRKRIEKAVFEILDISRMDDEAAAIAIRERNIDILVNLNGYFGEERTGIFAQRAAPIQVNYLGFPGTLGASYIDYLIADRVVIPPNHEKFYKERIVFLPGCYQANDWHRPIAKTVFTKSDCGLPPDSFVFCCFNNGYKIVPNVFDSWMRILKAVEGSVLWLIHDNADATANLRREALARGVEPGRLIFAERIAPAEHLARQRLADLFLDTLPYNAHTTASDALWAGLPVLTQIGETFPGKVAASLLRAIDLEELITTDRQRYEALAVELAIDRRKLIAIRQKLANHRLTTTLFDSGRFTRCIEAAYTTMYERRRSGLAPDHLFISPEI